MIGFNCSFSEIKEISNKIRNTDFHIEDKDIVENINAYGFIKCAKCNIWKEYIELIPEVHESCSLTGTCIECRKE